MVANISSVYGICPIWKTPQLFFFPAKQSSLNQITMIVSHSGNVSIIRIFSSSKMSVTIFIHFTSAIYIPFLPVSDCFFLWMLFIPSNHTMIRTKPFRFTARAGCSLVYVIRSRKEYFPALIAFVLNEIASSNGIKIPIYPLPRTHLLLLRHFFYKGVDSVAIFFINNIYQAPLVNIRKVFFSI